MAATESKITLKTYLVIFAILMVLLVVTVAVAYVHLPSPWGVTVAMIIAVAKATLVVLYFMHVIENSRLTKLIVVTGFIFLAIMVGITMTDYLTRDWQPEGYQMLPQEISSPHSVPASEFPQNQPGAEPHHGEDH